MPSYYQHNTVNLIACDPLNIPIEMSGKCGHADCKKKLTLTSITCKCEKTFCPAHRYPTDHACTFDFHENAKKVLLKTMSTPIVAPKLEMI